MTPAIITGACQVEPLARIALAAANGSASMGAALMGAVFVFAPVSFCKTALTRKAMFAGCFFGPMIARATASISIFTGLVPLQSVFQGASSGIVLTLGWIMVLELIRERHRGFR